jgi:hypothetical protein
VNSRPRLSQIPLWERHENRVLNILRDALSRLVASGPSGSEVEISRELYFCILEVNRRNRVSGDDWFDHPPTWEAKNPPKTDTSGMSSERKIPDLQWGYVDHEEPDPRSSARHFAIECKRLGPPTKAGWVFNLHYVNNGVVRFLDPDFKYGHTVASGAMIGYVQSMAVDAVLDEVEAATADAGIPTIERRGPHSSPVHEFEHLFSRPFPISPFKLVHLWVEL